MISYFNAHKKKVASTLLFVFLSNLSSPLISFAKPISGSSNPVSTELSKYVNPFTGDFSYSIPLMSVPGPNGENFPINLGYSAGIKMNQEASWIGLGWDFNPGEIVRGVNGVPDDWSSALVTSTDYLPRIGDQSIVDNSTKFFGPLYFNEFNGSNYSSEYGNIGMSAKGSMDLYQTNRLMGEHLFQFPNYDDYYFHGPGIGGQLTPNLFDFASLVQKGIVRKTSIGSQFCLSVVSPTPDLILEKVRNNVVNHIVYKHNYNEQQSNKDEECKPFSTNRKLQFRLKNEFPSRINSPIKYYEGLYTTPSSDGIGDYKVGETNLENLNSEKKMPAGSVVRYFTNSQIAMNKENLSNFIDFQLTPLYQNQGRDINGPNPKFPSKGIGAFQIITPDGVTYHYSLPVYSKKNVIKTFSIKNDPNNILLSNNYVDDENDFSITSKDEKYAVSWKLTAITGADFEDVNNNKFIDDGDKGYWITFDYGLFKDNVYQRFPYYNFVADYADRFQPILGSRAHPRHLEYSYSRQGTIIESEEEHYYLNQIKTATHTAFFIKDIRLDSHSKKTTTQARIPRLKLSKIILVKNDNIIPFPGINNIYPSEEDRFSLSVNNLNVISTNSYNLIKSQLDPVSLKIVDFEQDYSLCPKYYNNVNFNSFCEPSSIENFNSNNFDPKFGTNYTSTSPSISIDVFDNFVEQSCNASNLNTGKLTLNAIRFKEKGAVSVFPSYVFDYDQNNSIKNPSYYPDQQDYWGYYKSDFNKYYRGHYVSNDSKLNVDAWSLKKITTPLGAEININYESDTYTKVGYNHEEYDKLSDPQTTFLIRKVVSYNSTSAILEFFDKDATKFITQESIRKYGLPLLCSGQKIGISSIVSVNPSNNTITISYSSCSGAISVDEGIKGYISVLRPSFQSQALAYGGGLRVNSISIKDNFSGHRYTQEYNYYDGICTTEPDAFGLIKNNNDVLRKSNFASDRHSTPSNVGYTKVVIRDKSDNNLYNGKTEIIFSNYKETFRPLIQSRNLYSPNADIYKNNGIEINENKNTTYSLPLSITIYDNNNNIISKTINEYLTDKELEVSGAKVEESFHAKYQTANHVFAPCIPANPSYSPWTIQNYVYVKKQYTNVLKRQIVYQNDIKLVKEYVEFDALTGKPVKTIVTDPTEGVTLLSEIPAYRLSGNSELGSKIENPSNKNLLVLEGKKEIRKGKINHDIYNLNTEDESILIGGAKNIYGKSYVKRDWNPGTSKFESNITTSKWRLLKSLSFNGLVDDAQWRTEGENTLYDAKGNLIESKKNNRFSAVKYGTNNQTIAKGVNTNYAGFLFSSFEDNDGSSSYFVGEVKGFSRRFHATPSLKAHSGEYMLKIPSSVNESLHSASVINNSDSKGLIPGKTYVAKVWMHKNNPAQSALYVSYTLKKLGGVTVSDEKYLYRNDANNIQIGDWVLATLTIDIPANIIEWSGNNVEIELRNQGGIDAYFDDLIFSPIDAEVQGFVYTPTGQVSAEIAPNGMCTYYDYDAAGRVTRTYKETLFGIKKISENQYNFSR